MVRMLSIRGYAWAARCLALVVGFDARLRVLVRLLSTSNVDKAAQLWMTLRARVDALSSHGNA